MSSTQQLLLGEGAGGGIPNFIEDVFSTYLYTGTSAALTITNNIDLSTKGGLVWSKVRTTSFIHNFFDTARGVQKTLCSNNTDAEATESQGLTAFNSNGYTVNAWSQINSSTGNFVSWTFREQPKFFDVVTYTGDGASTQTISHNLGVTPGCIVIKKRSGTSEWSVYHRSLTAGSYLKLNATDAQAADSFMDGANAPTSTTFTAQLSTSDGLNANGATYVAYLWAHDAGGFGLTGTDNVISCGTFTPDGLGDVTVNLGYEAQWILYKGISGAGGSDSWVILDTMRGWNLTTSDKRLFPNSSGAENTSSAGFPTATGFQVENLSASPYIYIAIRRGPMKVPTLGTTVYGAVARTGTGATASVTSVSFPPDFLISDNRDDGNSPYFWDRLRGAPKTFSSASVGQEDGAQVDSLTAFLMNGISVGSDGSAFINGTSIRYINWFFKRAPSFFDEVCYTGTGSATTQAHNLTVVPELMIVKCRVGSNQNWPVYSSALANTEYVVLNTTAAKATGATRWNSTTPTSSVFTVGTGADTNGSGSTFVAYLFATCAGVSKVGSYTGTGTTQTINCGFTSGTRWVMIKRTDSTGDWYVWDSTRGIVPGNDPYLLLNSSSDAEVTGTDYVDTANSGFEITSTAPAAINANGGTYLFLAVA